MALLARMLCRWFGCPAPGPGRRERAADKAAARSPDEGSSDDLTVIRGIGIASQNRLHVAGIKTYADLAGTPSEQVRSILGKLGGGAKVDEWISRARELAGKG